MAALKPKGALEEAYGFNAYHSTLERAVSYGSNSRTEPSYDGSVRYRNGGPKSRRGCIVCKIRRVKCDETRPHCIRCLSTGRTCEGYAEPIPRRKRGAASYQKSALPTPDKMANDSPSMMVYTPSVDIQGSQQERRSFHYFRSRNMSRMPGNFEPHFWDQIVLQFSQHYPTVQQSLIALSALYEEMESDERDTLGSSSTMGVQPIRYSTLQQYNKAVRYLVEYLSSEDQDPRVALASCLIFVWIEFLQNSLDAGFQHLNCGLNILRNLRQSLQQQGQLLLRDNEDIYGSLERSFTRLRIQAAIHGSHTSEFTTSEFTPSSSRDMDVVAPIPHQFSNIFESRIYLDSELNSIFGYIRSLKDVDNYASVDFEALDRTRRGHLDRLQKWQISTKAMIAAPVRGEDPAWRSGVLYLQLYHTLLSIILQTLFVGSEMAYDEYTADFEKILIISEALILHSTSSTPTALSLDIAVIPPLFFLVLKCRLLRLRRKAIELLKLAPKQEGIWRRKSIVKYSEWKVMMEEAGRGDLDENDILPESARIYREHIPSNAGWGRANVNLVPLQIHFSKGPIGPDDTGFAEMPSDMEIVQAMRNIL